MYRNVWDSMFGVQQNTSLWLAISVLNIRTLQLRIPYLTGQTEKSMNEVIGHVYCTLEGRFTHVRTRETNLGWYCLYVCTYVVMYVSSYMCM